MFSLLQTYRGLAAVAVAAFHLSISFQDPRYGGHDVFGRFTSRMNLGVDFFFVLSGFIIAFAHQKDIGEPSRFVSFHRKRFIRLYPIYWIYLSVFCTLVALGFGAAANNPDSIPRWVSTITLIRLDNFLLPISPAWTLMHEVAFYFVFSLAILNARLGALVFAIWQIGCLSVFEYPAPDQRTAFATYLSADNLDFAIGIGAFALFRHPSKITPAAWGLAGAGVFILTSLIEAGYAPFGAAKCLYAVAFGVIVAGSAKYEFRRPKLRLSILPVIGDASYTIYLTHEAVIGATQKIMSATRAQLYLDSSIRYFIILAVVVATGIFVHKKLERPVLVWARGVTGGRALQPRAYEF